MLFAWNICSSACIPLIYKCYDESICYITQITQECQMYHSRKSLLCTRESITKSTLEHQRSNTGTTPSSSNASQLFSKFVSVCSDPSKIEHPLRKRFKFIARIMKDTFERDAGLGWLSRFNGKPKILRDTVKCLHRKNLDTNTSKLPHRLSVCFQDQSSAEMDPSKSRQIMK